MLKLQFKNNPQRSFWLVGEQLRLGSHDECDVILQGLGIHDRHALISIVGDVITLTPQPSAQCYVNDKVIEGPHVLHLTDEVRIGKERLLVVEPTIKSDSTKAVVADAKLAKMPIWSLTAEHPKLKDKPYLISGKSILGRSKKVGLFIPYKHLSREHAELSVVEGGLALKDLGSSNGCFVNGERVNDYVLTGGETVSFAFLDFKVNSPTAASDSVSLNETVMRSAITQADIEKSQATVKKPSQALDLSEINKQVEAEDRSEKPNHWVWGVVVTVLVAGVVYGWLQYAV